MPEPVVPTGHLTLYLVAPTVQDALEAVKQFIHLPPTQPVRKVTLSLYVEFDS